MRTQTVMTRPGPKSRVERMHDHANRLRTGPCRRGRCDWWMTRDGFRCRRCDEPWQMKWDDLLLPQPVNGGIWDPIGGWRRVLAFDPAAPDQPPIVASVQEWNGHRVVQLETGHRPTPYFKPALAEVIEETRARFTEAFRQAAAAGRLFPFPDDLEPYDLTAPAQRLIRVTSPTFIPIDPAVDIHPNGGIPG